MKKSFVTALLALFPAVGFAKVTDFNALISDNAKTQRELHANVQGTLEKERVRPQPRQRIVVVESSGKSYHSPTQEGALAFSKTKNNHKASEKRQFERLASEFNANEF